MSKDPPRLPFAPEVATLPEEDAVGIAQAAREQNDWPTALLALEKVASRKSASKEFHELRKWALEKAGRRRPSSPWHALKLNGAAIEATSEDLVALTHLVHEVRPMTVLEIGSRGGGLAHWLAQLCHGLGLDTVVHSADWGINGKSHDPRVQFWSGDLRKPSAIWPGSVMKRLSQPTLVVIRTQAGHDVTWSALRSLHKWMRKGDVFCVLDEPDADSPSPSLERRRSSVRAMERFAARHVVEYGPLDSFAEHFGPDKLITSLSCLLHTGLDPLDVAAAPGLDEARQRIAGGDWNAALEVLNTRKAARRPQRGVDYLRALCFLKQDSLIGACEAAKEELRYFPDHPHAAAMLASLLRRLFPAGPKLGGAEFHEIYRAVRPYTMLSDERLYSLYLRARLVCQMDIPGDFVECGVAAGGGSALLAATMARHTKRPRKLYACDTFEGMPAPTEKDVAYGTGAEASGWGSGTCAAPPGSLMEACAKLGVANLVVPVKGIFKDTLPGLREKIADGIAFLHMDGDWYDSTRDILVNLYDKTQARGFIQVDDYGYWEGCRQAMWDFAEQRGFKFHVHVIDGTGVWLQRPDRSATDLMQLNLGCGSHFHPAWVNIDIAPVDARVIQHDLAGEALPFEDASCSAVYHSHVLEHISPDKAPGFIAECFRVLAPGGVLRIAVPDLESIVRAYLRQLDAGDQAKHEWMVHELVDQLARNHSGGRMMEYWKQNPMPAEDFVFERLGAEVRQFVKRWRDQPAETSSPSSDPCAIGRFRLSGEVHQWMYDRLSLDRLLREAGFSDTGMCSATESRIPGFAACELDADASGHVRKPDSLFMEASRPVA